ncbi:unnamed protein product [Thlaspi arvense]|uniref:NPH3 domain-containing protein n=1 Tax=Thlaspi arvense TaxID=13288 RepID=A0AAU9RFB2_THLAR|nr:unnamed protein product [Thlaspi arvense]
MHCWRESLMVPDSMLLPFLTDCVQLDSEIGHSSAQLACQVMLLLKLEKCPSISTSIHGMQFPLLSRSGVMERLIAKTSDEGEEGCIIKLPDIPGGARTFEFVAKFCYGVKLELTSSNVVYLRCAAEHLEMTDEYGEGNLISQTELFLNQVVLRNWKDSLNALETCDDILPYAEELQITKRCIESLALKASSDPNLFGWPIMEHGGPLQSPGGSLLWNGISTGARPKNSSPDWWYEDVSSLSLPLYKRLISAMECRGIREEIIAGSLTYYAKKYLPGLNRRKGSGESSSRLAPVPPSEEEQKLLLEEIDRLLPMQKGLSHPWLAESDREQLCRLMDCQKLSLEACTHAAQNERLPLRIIVQVLFFEQLQLRTSIAGCFLVSDNLDGSRQLRSGLAASTEGGWATAVRENQVLKVGMDNMRMRVSELEKECSNMRQEIEKLGREKGSSSTWGSVSKKFGFKMRSQMCSAQEGSVSNHSNGGGKIEKVKEKPGKQKKKLS